MRAVKLALRPFHSRRLDDRDAMEFAILFFFAEQCELDRSDWRQCHCRQVGKPKSERSLT